MKKVILVVLGAALLVCGGCASTVKKVDVNKGLDSYYSQQRSADLLTVRGTNMTITYTGVTEYRVASILPAMNAIPRDPGVLEKAIDGLTGVAKWGIGWYFGSHLMSAALEQPRTVDPMVVRPEVVRPEVVTVPAAEAAAGL